MKQWIAFVMAVMLVLGVWPVAAEVIPTPAAMEVLPIDQAPTVAPMPTIEQTLGGRTIAQTYEELIVGTITPPDGYFFTGMFGNNTADIDVRDLLAGYALTEWNLSAGAYQIDASVVTGLSATLDAAGNKTYTIALADDLVYNDGTPITSRDYALDYILRTSPVMAEIGGSVGVVGVVGADAYTAGAANTIAGVRLLGDYQLSVTIAADYLPFFYELALVQANPYPVSVIAPGCEVADDGNGVYIRNIDQTVTQPIFTAALLEKTVLDPLTGYMSHPMVTSGPYSMTGYDQQTRVATFAINPNYKGDSTGKKPVIERLKLMPVDRETMDERLAAGDIDLINKATAVSDIDAGMQLVAQELARSSNYLRTGLSYISFTCEQGPTRSQKVRQAIALAFDRDGYLPQVVGNYGMAVNGYYGIGQWMVQLVNGTLGAPVAPLAEGATAEETAAFDAQTAAWAALTLDMLNPYALDLAAAKALLVEDGWTLNEKGEAFDEAKDAVRARMTDGQLEMLSLNMVVPEGSQAQVTVLDEKLAENLAQIGVQLTIEQTPFGDLLNRYYRRAARGADMFCLGTNFMTTFDPSLTYAAGDAWQTVYNVSGLEDAQLETLAVQMRKTLEGDVLTYCQNWLQFQQYWNEVLPAVPIYSNVYFDFYTPRLQNYQAGANLGWAKAVMYAYLSDVVEEPVVVEGDQPTGDGEIVIIE